MIDQMVKRDLFPAGSIRYHLTLASAVPSIRSQGLQPRSQAGTGFGREAGGFNGEVALFA